MATALFGSRISKLTVDQGREYCCKEQENWYKQKGIELETSMAYSTQQNGMAERFNRTLLEKAKALLLESGSHKKLWCEAVNTGTYLINRIPWIEISRLQICGMDKNRT